jgi:hypothetical protein
MGSSKSSIIRSSTHVLRHGRMHELRPKVTFRDGAQPFLRGECVLVRFSDPVSVDQGLDQDTSAVY